MLRGFTFGLIVLIVAVLLSLNTKGFDELKYLMAEVPGLLIILFLPVLTAIAGYYIARGMAKKLKKQHKQLEKESKRINQVLNFIDNLRKGDIESPIPISSEND